MNFNARSESIITLRNICLQNPNNISEAEKKYKYFKDQPYNIDNFKQNQEKIKYYKTIIDRNINQLFNAKIELIFRHR
jgi:hypothetical protein